MLRSHLDGASIPARTHGQGCTCSLRVGSLHPFLSSTRLHSRSTSAWARHAPKRPPATGCREDGKRATCGRRHAGRLTEPSERRRAPTENVSGPQRPRRATAWRRLPSPSGPPFHKRPAPPAWLHADLPTHHPLLLRAARTLRPRQGGPLGLGLGLGARSAQQRRQLGLRPGASRRPARPALRRGASGAGAKAGEGLRLLDASRRALQAAQILRRTGRGRPPPALPFEQRQTRPRQTRRKPTKTRVPQRRAREDGAKNGVPASDAASGDRAD